MTNEMKLNRFDQMGIALECSIIDQYLIACQFCFDDSSLKQLFPSYAKKRRCAKMIFSLTAASAGLSSRKEKNYYWMFFSNCNRSKQNVTVGSRFKVLKDRTTSA